MFKAKLNNKFSGVSKKNGKEFYVADFVVDLPSGNRVLHKAFLTKHVFDQLKDIPLDNEVVVMCGVNTFGQLVVAGVKSEM